MKTRSSFFHRLIINFHKMKKLKPLIWYLIALFYASSCTISENTEKEEWIDPLNETPEQRNERMEWWRNARFGLFIHWGVYSVPAGIYNGERIDGIGEWIMLKGKIPVAEYKKFARDFNPVKYDPQAWVRLAKEAGMKYIVITSKHHDGFALFDSKVTDWDIVDASPYGKDLLQPLVEAAKKEGIRIGFYYSQAQDWTHPGGAKSGYKEGEYWDEAQAGSFDDYLTEIAYPQLKEIFTNYDIDILWWDTPRWMNRERAQLLRPLIAMKPGLITNNRLGGGFKGDSDTPEQHIPATGIKDRDWEVCMTMNHTWGYKEYDDDWKSTRDLLIKLIDIASKGGNFLLNIGPKPDGTIPQESVDRLLEIGRWMKRNSESIYGTAASPFRRPWWGRCTQKKLKNGDTRLYLHIFDWPDDGKLQVPVNNEAVQCYALSAKNQFFDVKKVEEGLQIKLTGGSPDEISSVIVLDITGSPDVPNQDITQNENGELILLLEEGDLENRGYVSTNHAKLVRDKKHSYITWKETRTWMEWPVDIAKENNFEIFVTIATTSADNKIYFETGELKKEFQLPDTKGLGNFKKIRLGNIQLPAGTSTLMVKADKHDWQEMYLSTVELRPVR